MSTTDEPRPAVGTWGGRRPGAGRKKGSTGANPDGQTHQLGDKQTKAAVAQRLARSRAELVALAVDGRVAAFTALYRIVTKGEGSIADQTRAAAVLINATDRVQPDLPLSLLLADAQVVDGTTTTPPSAADVIRAKLAEIGRRQRARDGLETTDDGSPAGGPYDAPGPAGGPLTYPAGPAWPQPPAVLELLPGGRPADDPWTAGPMDGAGPTVVDGSVTVVEPGPTPPVTASDPEPPPPVDIPAQAPAPPVDMPPKARAYGVPYSSRTHGGAVPAGPAALASLATRRGLSRR